MKRKRDGYGECYDYHPLIGPAVQDHPYDTKAKMYFQEWVEGKVYKGYWKKGKKVSK